MKKKFLSAILAVGVCLQGTVLPCCATNSTGNTTWANSTITDDAYCEADVYLQNARKRVEDCMFRDSLMAWGSRLGIAAAALLGWWMGTWVASRYWGRVSVETQTRFLAELGSLNMALHEDKGDRPIHVFSVPDCIEKFATEEQKATIRALVDLGNEQEEYFSQLKRNLDDFFSTFETD